MHRDFCDAVCARHVIRRREDDVAAIRGDRASDLVAIRRDHDALGDVRLYHALPRSDDERESGEESKGFSGETRRAQTSWDDGERPHTGRSGRYVSARTAANITF